MSDTPYLDQLIGSSASNEETDRKQIGAPTTVVAPQASPTFPEDFEAVEADEAYPILGNVTGIGAEIGTGLYLTKRLHRSQQFLKWARGAKAVSAAAIVTPEPASTVAGLGTFALSEAAIWGVSNVIGQGIRKSFGVQDNISAGEVLASSVFGVGLVTKGGQKLISLGDGLAQMKAWGKGNELFVQGAKSFVSGATLGIAETALRQEVQLLLNERENRDAVEYLIGGAAGGGFNTMFDVFSRTGKWGQAKAKQVTSRAKEALAKKADELEARAETIAPRGRPRLLLEAKRIRKSINLVDDLGQQLDTASEALNNPKPKEAPEAPTVTEEQVNLANDWDARKAAEGEEVTPTNLEGVDVVEAPEAPATPKETPEATPAPKTPEVAPEVTPRQQSINSLKEQLSEMDSTTMSQEMPSIERDAKKIYTDLYDEISVNVRKLEKENNPEAITSLLSQIKELRELNINVKDVVETTAGRTLQAARRDASKYKWADQYSMRSQQEDAALALLEETLERGNVSSGDDVSEIFNDFLGVKPKLKEEGKKLRAEEKAQTAKSDKEGKPKKELTPEEEAVKVTEQLAKKKAKLQEELDAKQKEFTGQKDLQDPKEASKAPDPEIKDLQERIKWYKDAEAEVKTVADLEKRLAELAGIEGAGDMSTLRKTTATNLKPPSKSSPKVQELNTKIAESKARMRQKLKEIDKAYDEIQNPKQKKSQEELDAEAEKVAITRLEEQLKELRAIRSGLDNEPDAKVSRKKSEKELDLEERIKFYKDEKKQIENLEKAKVELARLAAIEGEGNITQLRNETKGKPEMPSKIDVVADVKKKIAESKARMRKKLSDIDNANKKMEKEDYKRFRATLMTDIENALYKALDVDGAGKVTKAFRWLAQSRQMALINQLPSALAGVPTGIIALGREVNRGVANYVSQKFAGNELAGELAKADIGEALNNFKYLFSKDNWKAVGRTLKDNQSATDPRKAGRMDDEVHRVNVPRGEAALVASARRRAEKALKAKESLISKAGQEGSESTLERMNRLYFLGQSGGVRLIQGLDEAFKRPLIMGRVRASARKEAIMELHELKKTDGVAHTPADIDELAKQKFDAALIDSDGLMVLRANHEYLEEVDLARQELLFAANSDNIEEVVTPYSEKVVQSLKQLAGNDHPISFGLNAVMPYIGVPIRGVYKGLSWLSSVPRATGGLVGGDAFGNPYIAKVKQAQDELLMLEKLQKKRGDSPFDEKGLEAVNTLDGAKAELLEKINRADARRIQYNADNLADALMVVELSGLMVGAAALGSGTGSMTFLSEDQKKKLELAGTKPFQLFGMDYKAIGPAAFPLVVAGDISQYLKIRKVEAQMGTTILDEDLNIADVVLKSLTSLAKEQPLSSGVKQVTEMLGNDEQRKVAASSMLSSYTLMPAFAKKAVQQYNNAGRMVDLKGSTFADRMAYGALGMGISNYKTDYFGHDIEDPRGFIQNNVMRQWPTAKKLRTTLEDIIGSDLVGTIQAKPEYIQTGIRMKDFIDARGVSMTYRFDQQLKETKINGKTMLAAVQAKIFNSKWRTKFEGSAVADGDIMVNVGLVELNELMRKYYDKTKEDILKDRGVTSLFINKDNESLNEVIKSFNNGDFLKDSGPVNLADIISPQ